MNWFQTWKVSSQLQPKQQVHLNLKWELKDLTHSLQVILQLPPLMTHSGLQLLAQRWWERKLVDGTKFPRKCNNTSSRIRAVSVSSTVSVAVVADWIFPNDCKEAGRCSSSSLSFCHSARCANINTCCTWCRARSFQANTRPWRFSTNTWTVTA